MSEGATISAPARACDKRGFGQPGERSVVIHIAIDDFSAMAVAGVLAVADVGDHQQLGHRALHGAHGALHDPVVGVGFRRRFVFVFRDAEQNHAAEAEPLGLFALLHQLIDRKLVIAGHGADLSADSFTGADEQRQDQMRRVEVSLSNQPAHRLGYAQAAFAVNWKRHYFLDCTGTEPGWRRAARDAFTKRYEYSFYTVPQSV